jgi:hypothetical protein
MRTRSWLPLSASRAAGCRSHRIGCSREGDEEGVALCVDLNAVVLGERFSQRGSVLGEKVGVPGTVFLEEPGRALDVREKEGDGAGRKLGPGHTPDDFIGDLRSHPRLESMDSWAVAARCSASAREQAVGKGGP